MQLCNNNNLVWNNVIYCFYNTGDTGKMKSETAMTIAFLPILIPVIILLIYIYSQIFFEGITKYPIQFFISIGLVIWMLYWIKKSIDLE